jgi:hypothetical protein
MSDLWAPVELEWRVSAAGYLWMDGRSRAELERTARYLVPKKKVETNEVTGEVMVSEPTETYVLRAESDLFWKFARTELTEPAILQFAKRYGLLGAPAGAKVVIAEEMEGKVLHVVDGVELGVWKQEICRLRWAAELWLAASTNDQQTLEDMVHVARDQVTFLAPASPFPDRPLRARTTIPQIEKRLGKQVSRSDVRLLALDYAAQLLGGCLSQTTTRHIVPDETTWDLVDRYAPKGLLGMLWVQLHSATQRKATYRNCSYCRTPFEVTAGSGRSDRLYCSDYHRIAAVQARKKEALALRALGKSPSEIAKSVGADLAAVKRWISGQ